MIEIPQPKFILSYYNEISGNWGTCNLDGSPDGIFNGITENNFRDGIQARILKDNPINESLGEDFHAGYSSSISLEFTNTDRKFGTAELGCNLWEYIRRDDMKCQLSILVPTETLKFYPSDLVVHYLGKNYVLVWAGFLTDANLKFGGDFVNAEFRDYNYWVGQILCEREYLLKNRTDLINELVELVPFIIHVEARFAQLPDVWDLKKVCSIESLTFDVEEIVRGRNENEAYVRHGRMIYRLYLLTGLTEYVGSLPNDILLTRTMHDPALKGTFMPSGWTMPPRVSQSLLAEIHIAQDFCWDDNNLYILKVVAEDIELWRAQWNGSDYGTGVLIHTFAGIANDGARDSWTLFADLNPEGHVEVLFGCDGSDITYRCREFDSYYDELNMGHLIQVVYGRTWALAAPYFNHYLSYKKDNSYYWLSQDGSKMSAGSVNSRIRNFAINSCYRLSSLNYPNCVVNVQYEKDTSYLLILDEHFEIKERLYPGRRPPQASRMQSSLYSATQHCSLRNDNTPMILGLEPGANPGDNAVQCVYEFVKRNSDFVPYVDGRKMGIGKVFSALSKTIVGFWQIRPNMNLVFRSIDVLNAAGAIPLIAEIKDGGDADEQSIWDQNIEQIKMNYNLDMEKSIGKELWNHKSKTIDLKEIIFSSSYAKILLEAAYITYKPQRLKLTAPLYRASKLDLWGKVFLHGFDWVNIFTQLDIANMTSEVNAIEKKVGFQVYFDFLIKFEIQYFWDIQYGWYYRGEPLKPAHDQTGIWLSYPSYVRDMIINLLNHIEADLNAQDVPDGEFDIWWEEHRFDYWDEISAIIEALEAGGYFG